MLKPKKNNRVRAPRRWHVDNLELCAGRARFDFARPLLRLLLVNTLFTRILRPGRLCSPRGRIVIAGPALAG
jgi:hypothetical protein